MEASKEYVVLSAEQNLLTNMFKFIALVQASTSTAPIEARCPFIVDHISICCSAAFSSPALPEIFQLLVISWLYLKLPLQSPEKVLLSTHYFLFSHRVRNHSLCVCVWGGGNFQTPPTFSI